MRIGLGHVCTRTTPSIDAVPSHEMLLRHKPEKLHIDSADRTNCKPKIDNPGVLVLKDAKDHKDLKTYPSQRTWTWHLIKTDANAKSNTIASPENR